MPAGSSDRLVAPAIHLAVLSRYPLLRKRPHKDLNYLLYGRRFRVSRGFAEMDIQIIIFFFTRIFFAKQGEKDGLPSRMQNIITGANCRYLDSAVLFLSAKVCNRCWRRSSEVLGRGGFSEEGLSRFPGACQRQSVIAITIDECYGDQQIIANTLYRLVINAVIWGNSGAGVWLWLAGWPIWCVLPCVGPLTIRHGHRGYRNGTYDVQYTAHFWLPVFDVTQVGRKRSGGLNHGELYAPYVEYCH